MFSRLTVFENLRMGGLPWPRAEVRDGVTRVYDLFPRLKERRGQNAGTLCGGEQQMLAIGRALMVSPIVLLLDEPSMGLSPTLTEQIFTISGDQRAGHHRPAGRAERAHGPERGHRGYVLQSGQILLADSAANLAANEQVRQAYLGEI